jgi:hypothetical protein
VTIEEAHLEAINSHILAEQLTEMYARFLRRIKVNVSVVSSVRGRSTPFLGSELLFLAMCGERWPG